MTARDGWMEVGDRLQSLGLKLKLHAEEELADRDDEELDSTYDRLRSAVEEVVDALGDAARDPAVRADVRGVAEAFAGAARSSVDEVRAGLRRRE